MSKQIPFGKVLDAVKQLSDDEQETMVAILHRRMVTKARRKTGSNLREAKNEFAAGSRQVTKVDKIMREVQA